MVLISACRRLHSRAGIAQEQWSIACLQIEQNRPGTFDMVALWNVTEHVEDSEALLKQAYHLLRPHHGVLHLETPDDGCLARRLVRLAHGLTGGE